MMVHGILIKTVLLVSISKHAYAQSACEVCSCQPSPQLPTLTLCEDGNLTALPANISSLTKLLHVNGKVERILATDLEGLSQLTDFEINNNNLSVIEPGAFRDLTNLQKISLSNNSVSQVSGNILTGLGNLTHLDMDNNRIESVPDFMCNMLTSVEYLNAKGNEIQSIGSDVFTGCGSLSHIDISDNQMTYIAEDAFLSVDSLSTLDISGNRLTTFYSAWLVNKTSALNLIMDDSGWHCTTQLKIEYQKMNESHPSIIGCNIQSRFCPLCANFGGRRLENVTMEELVIMTTNGPMTSKEETKNPTNGNFVTTTTNNMTTTSSADTCPGNESLMFAMIVAFFIGTMH